MINDYHKIRIESGLRAMPDAMVHDLAVDVELKILEAGIKPQDVAILYESILRQSPKIFNQCVTEHTGAVDQVG